MSLSAKVFLVAAIPMIVPLCSGFLAYGAETRANDTLVAATHANEVRHQVDALVADILQAESSMRGYLLTGYPGHLASANVASSASNSDVIQLKRLTASDAGQAPAIGRLQQLITDRLTVLNELSDLERTTTKEAASWGSLSAIQRTPCVRCDPAAVYELHRSARLQQGF